MRSSEAITQKGKEQTRELRSVRKEFESWRNNRTKRERIPEYLWEEAVRLCQYHKTSLVVKELRLNYNALTNRLKGQEVTPAIRDNTAGSLPIKFIEFKGGQQDFQSAHKVLNIEIQKPDGTLMKLRVPGNTGIDVPDLITIFSCG